MKLHDVDGSRDHDFGVLPARPTRHDAIDDQPDEGRGDLPLAPSLRALFSLFDDRQTRQIPKI